MMIIKYMDYEITGTPAEVMELINMTTKQSKAVPADMNDCDGEICVGDCDKCDKSTEQEVKPAKPKQVRGPYKKVLDVGKMRALRNANWSYAKIADEMRCSESTVYKKLKEA